MPRQDAAADASQHAAIIAQDAAQADSQLSAKLLHAARLMFSRCQPG
jgi:hypothetical protein